MYKAAKVLQTRHKNTALNNKTTHQAGHARLRVAVRAVLRPSVVLTREKGKNGKMMQALKKYSMDCIELPLIKHQDGPDKARLPEMLMAGDYDWVALTSPEAASVFLEGWAAAGKPEVRIAVVGEGTGSVVAAAGITPLFTSSKALGKTMGLELPHVPGGSDKVLYPASTRASTNLQDSLASSGFQVTRIHTYNTVGVKAADVAGTALTSAKTADIVTFGSPSAVQAWVELVGKEVADGKVCVCIGSTSARACQAAGLTTVLFPEAPGIEGWVGCVLHAAELLHK